ncbi:hypothetical protein LAN32_22110, partial [Mycobacterium tuberculosis]|nr:hypothetical protein [Mycobacterium tuberculosis]
ADRLAPFAHQLKATAALEAVVRQAKSPHSEAQQMRDFIANGGKLTPADNPNAQAIQDELKDIDSQ